MMAIAALSGQEIKVCQLVFFNKKETRMQLTARHQEYWSKECLFSGSKKIGTYHMMHESDTAQSVEPTIIYHHW